MIVAIATASSVVELRDRTNMKEFSATADSADPDAIDATLCSTGAGHYDGSHAWISAAWIVSGSDGDADWRAGFDAMKAFAVKMEWYDAETDTIRAHLAD